MSSTTPVERPAGTPWRRLGLFSLLPMISALSPLAILPVIARVTGAEGWAAVAIGQSIGVAAIALVDFGWTTQGPRLVAGLDGPARRRLLVASVYARLVSGLPTFALVVVSCLVLAPPRYAVLCVVVGVASATSGLLPTWYFIALGRPREIARYDTVPRVLAALFAIPLVFLTGSALPFALLLLLVTLGSVAVSTVREGAGGGRPRTHRASIVVALHTGWPLAVSGIVMSGYTSMSIPLFTVAVGGLVALVASFAAAVRIMNMAQGALRGCTNSLQGWVTEVPGDAARARMRKALTVNASVSVVMGAMLAAGLPVIDSIIFGPEIEVSAATAGFVGLALSLNGVSSSLACHVLAPSMRVRVIAVSITLASVTGVALIITLARLFGVAGAAAAVALSEAVVFGVQLPYALRILGNRIRGGGRHRCRGCEDGP